MFYHLIPLLGHADKTSGSTRILVFSIQVTLFPNSGISMGVTDTSPLLGVVINPIFDESYLKLAKVENFKEEYQPAKLCGPTNKVRATFILPRIVLNKLKTLVSTQVPTLAYVSSFMVAWAYAWSCMTKTHNDEL
ncbi:putative chloramphenicol acetyltransferase-like domain superfamily [Helianthus anomalus]